MDFSQITPEEIAEKQELFRSDILRDLSTLVTWMSGDFHDGLSKEEARVRLRALVDSTSRLICLASGFSSHPKEVSTSLCEDIRNQVADCIQFMKED